MSRYQDASQRTAGAASVSPSAPHARVTSPPLAGALSDSANERKLTAPTTHTSSREPRNAKATERAASAPWAESALKQPEQPKPHGPHTPHEQPRAEEREGDRARRGIASTGR